MLHTNDQPNIPSGSGERVCFVGFAIFSYGGQLGLLIGLHLTVLKPCSLVMLHVKFENHGVAVSKTESLEVTLMLGSTRIGKG